MSTYGPLAIDASGNYPANVVIDSSQNNSSFDPLTTLTTYTTTIIFTVSGESGPQSYQETDVVIRDASGNLIFQNIVVVGITGPSGNSLDADVENEVVFVSGSTGAQALSLDISGLVAQIQSSPVTHLGSLNDYLELLQLAQTLEDVSGSITLNLDIAGLTAFAAQAELYGDIFSTINETFNGITNVDDTTVLANIKAQLQIIADMYTNIGALHVSIERASTLQIPETINTAATQIQSVIDKITESLPYLEYFADPSNVLFPKPVNADMSPAEKSTIEAAKNALRVWGELVNAETTVVMSNNSFVQNLKNKIAGFATLTTRMNALYTRLNSVLSNWQSGIYTL
jgi:hypothetical protein